MLNCTSLPLYAEQSSFSHRQLDHSVSYHITLPTTEAYMESNTEALLERLDPAAVG